MNSHLGNHQLFGERSINSITNNTSRYNTLSSYTNRPGHLHKPSAPIPSGGYSKPVQTQVNAINPQKFVKSYGYGSQVPTPQNITKPSIEIAITKGKHRVEKENTSLAPLSNNFLDIQTQNPHWQF
jgi:hypothetical protein